MIAPELDYRIRARLAELYEQAPDYVFSAAGSPGAAWVPAPHSRAAQDPGVVLPTSMVQLDGEAIDLPLTTTHGFLWEAGDAIDQIGRVQLADAHVRLAVVGPLARASAERSATAVWLLEADDPGTRLARALLLELLGIATRWKFLEGAGHDDSSRFEAATHDLQRIAEKHFGQTTVEFDRHGKVLSVAGERLPNKTELFRRIGPTPQVGAAFYGELSTFTHPTAGVRGMLSRAFTVEHRQLIFDPPSTVHDEGRLLQPTLIGLGSAVGAVAGYLGRPAPGLTEWLISIIDLWQEWCTANGCS